MNFEYYYGTQADQFSLLILRLDFSMEEIYIPNIWKWNSAWKMTEQINI